MVRGAVVRRDGMIKVDTQSHRTILVLLIIISPGPPPEAPLLPIGPQMRLLGCSCTYFGACLGSYSQGVSWQWLNEVTRDVESVHNGTLVRGPWYSDEEIVEICRLIKLLQDQYKLLSRN